MSGMTRCFFRWGLIGGLALGGLTLLVGPERVATGLAQIRTSAQGVVDQVVDDPVALRRQLEKLAEEYPDRIAEVRGEIAEVNHQIVQLERDVEIAGRVVAYTTEDLTVLQTRIAKAKDELPAAGSRGVFIRFEGVRYDVDEAYTEAMRIGEVRKNYRDRLAMDREQAKMLEEQKTRLHQILSKLEDDFGTYQAQLWALDRQIDAIQRNDRLIELMEQQEKTLASYNKYEKVSNLKQLQGKLAELREIQKAQLETLSKRTFRDDYESRAKMDFENEDEVDVFEDIFEEDTTDEKTTAGSVAWAPPIVIE
jgi:chromosome segregation ATPase